MLALTNRRPLNDAGDLFSTGRNLGRLIDEAFQGWPIQSSNVFTSSWIPTCDVFEGNDAVKMVVEIPGVSPEDVKISLEHNVLTVRGEKRQQAEEQHQRVHRYERSYGVFERNFALPSTIDPDRIDAAYENGVLTITLPKAERARPREIPVRASR